MAPLDRHRRFVYIEDMDAADFRAAMDAMTLSQRRLAAILGVTPRTVNRWAKGRLPVPQYAVAYLDLLHAGKKPYVVHAHAIDIDAFAETAQKAGWLESE